MNPKHFFLRVFLTTLVIFSLPALAVVVFDPFFVFHKPFFDKDIGFDGTDRYQNAGLINSYLADPEERIDTVLLGTSMSQNFPVSALKNEHGVSALKLTLAGGTAKEISFLARKAIATGSVRHVVWEVFTSYAGKNPDALHASSPLPVFLYNESGRDDWRYVFNNDVVEEALKVAIGKKKKRRPLEDLYTWEHVEQFEHFSSERNVRKLRKKLIESGGFIRQNPLSLEGGFPNITENLLPVLRDNPDVRFSLFFPPVSHYGYARYGDKGFWRQMNARAFVLSETRNLPHVSVYGFDLEDGWGGDLRNYMDESHYTPQISRRILSSIAEGNNRLEHDGFQDYVATLVRRVNKFMQ